jgi:D-sedoheptulose 7-phosphate isomerase
MRSIIERQFEAHRRALDAALDALAEPIERACALAVETLRCGRKILLFGNGGSAADAQHIAAEFTGRFKLERRGLPAIALTTDTSALTSIANDYGYDQVFARQVEALAVEGDLLIGYSTSGASPSVNRAVERGRDLGCSAIGFTGKSGGDLKALCDVALVVPSQDTARIQEMHLLIGHTLCHVTEQALYGSERGLTLYKKAA